MPENDTLIRWLSRRGARVDKGTLGQFMILVELAASTSVAEVGRARGVDRPSTAVNYRQKLGRLEQALGLGRLTYRDGLVTRPTEIGARVAREAELFLHELRSISASDESPTWLVGAGESWLQPIIVPAVVSLAAKLRDSCWEVKNLRAHEIAGQLRAGKLHFGFMRLEDAKAFTGIERAGPAIPLPGFRIVARNAQDAPTGAAALINWLIRTGRPLVQQGTSWGPISRQIDRQLGLKGRLEEIRPRVVCETHVQAVSALAECDAWCIAPAVLCVQPAAQLRAVAIKSSPADEAGLFMYPRALGRFAGWEDARSKLRGEIGQKIARFC